MAENSHDNAIIEPTPFARAEATGRGTKVLLKPLPIAIGTLFLLLAVAAIFMFSATAVRFSVTPAPQSFEIESGFSYQLGERYLMLPGTYRIRAALAGYHPLDTEINVSGEDDQDFQFELAKLPGILTITVEPDVVAEVFVDRQSRGVTPLTLDQIEPGLRDISFVSDRYLPLDTEIEIEGMRIEQELSVTLLPAWADISVDSLPDGARIFVDGDEIGQTPATLEIIQGSREIVLRRAGYKAWQARLDVTAGVPDAIPLVRLVRADGKVSVNSTPAGANVTIGGRYRGQTPLEVALRPGDDYEVLLSKVGFETVQRAITVLPDEDIALNATLAPVIGVVRLVVEPAGGELFIDGKPAGKPNQRLELTARSHALEIRKEGYASYTATVTPQPGLAQQLMVQLQTEAEAEVAAIPTEIETNAGPVLKLIIPDRLTMGAGRREPGRRSNEIEKDVLLTRPYFLSVHEITNAEYQRFAPNHESGVLGRTLLGQDERPVVNVSWEDAVRYCNWLSNEEGLPPAYEVIDGRYRAVEPLTSGYRLPTEAEWAWAARYAGGAPTRFPWGDAMPPEKVHANYADESARAMVPYHLTNYNDAYRGPAPVGSFAPNAFGIFDLAGNVSEWIHDFYSISMVREQLTDPTGPPDGEYHVVRGSNYTHGRFSELRWTYRDYGEKPGPEIGFRIARYVE